MNNLIRFPIEVEKDLVAEIDESCRKLNDLLNRKIFYADYKGKCVFEVLDENKNTTGKFILYICLPMTKEKLLELAYNWNDLVEI